MKYRHELSFQNGTLMSEQQATDCQPRKSIYVLLREWDTDSTISDALSLTDSQLTLPPSQLPVYVLASCSDESVNSSLIANCSSGTYSESD